MQGQLTALMGPSGSGKTTLLNVLAQRDPATKVAVSGDITIDGLPVASHAFQKISSYVEQEDALIGSLTVRETLDFAARLSLPTYAYLLDCEREFLTYPKHCET